MTENNDAYALGEAAYEDTLTSNTHGMREPVEIKKERLRLSVALMQRMHQRATSGSVKKMAETMKVDWRAVNDILKGKRYPQAEMAYAFVSACYKLVGFDNRQSLEVYQERKAAGLDTQEAEVIRDSITLLHALGYSTLIENRAALDAIRAMNLPHLPSDNQ